MPVPPEKVLELNSTAPVPEIELFHYKPGDAIPSGWDLVLTLPSSARTSSTAARIVYRMHGSHYRYDCSADKETTFAKYPGDRYIIMMMASSELLKGTRNISLVRAHIKTHIVKLFTKVFNAHFEEFTTKEITYSSKFVIEQEYMQNRFCLAYFVHFHRAKVLKKSAGQASTGQASTGQASA